MAEKQTSKVGSDYMKYAGWGFQLFVFLGVAAYAGQKLDQKFQLEKPICTIIFLFAILTVQLYKLVKDLS